MPALQPELRPSSAVLSSSFPRHEIRPRSAANLIEMVHSIMWKNFVRRAIPTGKYLGVIVYSPRNCHIFEQVVNSSERQKICSATSVQQLCERLGAPQRFDCPTTSVYGDSGFS